MIRIFFASLFGLGIASATHAQDAATTPPPAPTPPVQEGALLGGTLTPGAAAGIAIVGIGIAIAGSGSSGTTTTTTQP